MRHTLRALLAALLAVFLISGLAYGQALMPGERAHQYGPTPNKPLPISVGGTGCTDPYCLAPLQIARNGSMAIAQRTLPVTTNNVYSLDGWRNEIENASGDSVSQDTADVPVGAGFAAKLTVGSGNNGKFGLFSPIENKDMLKVRGGVVSLIVPLKATAGLIDGVGKIRMAVLYWTSTADSVSASPISTWNAEGVNPTLAANWNYANVPVALPVTTSWGTYTLNNVAIPLTATNIAIFIWDDDRVTTATTDILRIGGFVTLTQGALEAAPAVLSVSNELGRSQRYYFVDTIYVPTLVSGVAIVRVSFPAPMRTAPSIAGGGAGFTTIALGVLGTTCYQTTTAQQALTFDGDL